MKKRVSRPSKKINGNRKRKINFKVLALCVLIPLVIGFIGGIFTSSSVSNWYSTLNKPSFNPPSWIFSPVWTLLYILMGIALYLVFVSNSKYRKAGLILFGVQLGLNLLWSILFFGLRNPYFAFIEILVLWIWILVTIVYFFRIDKKAGWLMIPYILWVSFAALLNYMIFVLN